MIHSEVHKFPYTRASGMQRTYDVTINLVRRDSGVYAYRSWVHYAGRFKGNGLDFPLVSRTTDHAITEARARVEEHIEHLLGVTE
ncbi:MULTISPECIES: hypothetical protein [Paraburkholderia]|jgi:hypothetical protein|uniref:Uncharacterized protein n=1 Tax=Paraburkholderia caribensis TaxID=75105 RepID=A0A9Q6S987_9BURK|nr:MULTISPECIES: hypothetical protein [Paraburkholderia]AMV48557.1 hypothetical protein ATN79_48825 [Paraburkholderia caribensis]MCO4877469.1 hypothetical protein [Paraburkholderia caribensis]MDR6380523.1 hypothetical protein [Paraburkholderia caribensis]PTB29975.1 hypothetical protein C9I56_04920 [Paraburkholderia caribensis]QLB67135.1 hypothetical protein A9O66_32145 [Paraburkholderia caribensis]